MTTNTYRLVVALQAKAIESIDLHAGGVYTVAHTFGDGITVVARYRTGADQRVLQMWARDADAHLLGSAEASIPVGGGLIQPRHRIPLRSPALGTPHHPHRRSVPQPRRARLRCQRAPQRTQHRIPRLRARRLLPQPRLGPRPVSPRHHLVPARRHRPHRPGPGPHQGRHRHRRQLRGRPAKPPLGRRLTPRRAPGSPPSGPGHAAATPTTS
jgi:hypothetical protein